MKKWPSIFRRQFSTKIETTNYSEKWNSVIGLEIHAQISTKSKLFSGSSTEFGASPNSLVSFFDCATPGTLPRLNRSCVEAGVSTALALSCKINQVSYFDRKHYFYADLPSGFQITQQRQPIATDGNCEFYVYNSAIQKEPYLKKSRIKQVQLEQDSGKSFHDEANKKNLVDLNRAGVPLMELVFEPDLSNGEEAAALVKELSAILKSLGTCSCKMEEGALRVDANISINKHGEPLGVRTEVKNISSFRAIARAINYEIERQIQIKEEGGEITNETLMWDALKNRTILMRDKEKKQDYRFMPEPNLPPLCLFMNENSSENYQNLVNVTELKKQMPELPRESRKILNEKYDVSLKMTIQLMNVDCFEYFLKLINQKIESTPREVASFVAIILLEFFKRYKISPEECPIGIEVIGRMVDMHSSLKVNHPVLRKVLNELLLHPEKTPEQIVEENNWYQIIDEEKLKEICRKVLKEKPKMLRDWKKGKPKIYPKILKAVNKASDELAHLGKLEKVLQETLEEMK